jgi:hypothetical protein
MLGEATYMPQRTGRVEDKEMDRARLERLRLSGEAVVPGLHAGIRAGGADRRVNEKRKKRNGPLLQDRRPDVRGGDHIGICECSGQRAGRATARESGAGVRPDSGMSGVRS